MSHTTPVRWWRDDATRYQSRPPYVSPPYVGPQFDHFIPVSVISAIAQLQGRVNSLVRSIEGNLEQACGCDSRRCLRVMFVSPASDTTGCVVEQLVDMEERV